MANGAFSPEMEEKIGIKAMRVELAFRLPGTLSESACFIADTKTSTVKYVFSVSEFLAGMAAVAKDKDRLSELLKAGIDINDAADHVDRMLYEGIMAMNKKAYGKAEVSRATVQGELKPLFDYAAEVKEAKQAWPELKKKLELDKNDNDKDGK